MTFLLKQIFGFLKLLNSETGTNQLAAGIAAGFVLGMTPSLSLQSLLIFVCLLIFRIQFGAAFLSAFFFKFVAYLLDPVFDAAGSKVLEAPELQSLWTTLYNMPLVPLTRFNNSVVMGSGIVALALFPLVFFISRQMILKYRVIVVARFKSTKVWKAIQATSLYQWYYKYEQLFG
jgi:uncharacterized protein (TIGR03546 family)